MIFVVKVVPGREESVLRQLSNKILTSKLPIQAIAFHPKLRGYIFIECNSLFIVRSLLSTVRGALKVIEEPVPFDEVKRVLFEEEIPLQPGDTVEIVSGPLTGHRAKIIRIRKRKSEAVCSLLTTNYPFTVTLHLSTLKLVKK